MARIDEDKLQTIFTMINELKTNLNALRADFRGHDHQATYATDEINIAATAVTTITGTETSAEVTGSVPANVHQS